MLILHNTYTRGIRTLVNAFLYFCTPYIDTLVQSRDVASIMQFSVFWWWGAKGGEWCMMRLRHPDANFIHSLFALCMI